jgi:hypothetical protein
MALTATINESAPAFASTSLGPVKLDNQQVLIQDVYVKVESVFSSKKETTATVSFTHNNSKVVERSFGFSIDLNGPNPIKQAYEYLKTLPEFSDATDC